MKKAFHKIIKNIIAKGSLICLSLMIIPQAALAASVQSDMVNLREPAGMSIEEAKNGIVRVTAGTVNEDGKFKQKSTATGIIVSNDSNSVYIVTDMDAVDFGEYGKIQVVIKNDSPVDAVIEQPYKEKGFCILSAENKFYDRGEVALRVPAYDAQGEELAAGDEITALGFPDSLTDASEFSATDVNEVKGSIVKTAADNSGYIDYGASIPDGFEGGVLVDKDGYAVGLITGKDKMALDITEVDTAFIKEGKPYRSKDKDLMYAELYKMCNDEETFNKADKNTQVEIRKVRSKAIEVLEYGPYDREGLTNAIKEYNAVVNGGGWKTSRLLILVIVLGALIVLLTVRLILLILWNRKNDPYGEHAEKRIRKDKRKFGNKKAPKKATTEKGKAAGRNTTSLSGRRAEPAAAQLMVLRTGRSMVLNSGMTTMGKSHDADLSIPDNNRISRHHAAIAFRNGQYYLYDQGSTNGTFLNNMPVDANGIRLISGDIIRLANEDIQFIQQ